MAVTENTYTGDGSTVLFSFTFPYLKQSDIRVSINGLPTSAFTFANQTTLQMSTAPANGDVVKIFRVTDQLSPNSTFSPGSSIRSSDLNNNFLQTLYIAQETADRSITGSNPKLLFDLDFNSNTGINVGSPTDGNDICTKGYADSLAISANPSFTQNGSGAVARTWDSKLKDIVSVKDFGAVGDGATDDTAAIQAALNYVQAGNSTEGPYRKLIAPAGDKYRTTAPLTITKPCIVEFLSMIEYDSNVGSALIIGDSSTRNTGYDLTFTGFRHKVSSGGWSVPPTVAGAGANGVEVRKMQFSKLRIDKIIAFRGAGFFANCQGVGALGFNGHVQQNDIYLGEIGYCGWGVRSLSSSASLAAFQANHIRIQDLITNYYNLEFDQSGGIFTNTTSNTVFLNACELAAPGGSEIRLFGNYNTFNVGFLEGNFLAGNTSFYNVVRIGNNQSSGVSITNQGTRNWIQTCPPNDSLLPGTATISSGSAIQNNFGVPICLAFTASLNPGAEVTLSVGITSTPPIINKADNSAAGADSVIGFPFFAVIPPGYFWKVDTSGTVSFTTARLYQASA